MNDAEEAKRRAIVALQRKERIGYIEARRRVEEATPETAAPPAVRCSEWVAELEAALTHVRTAKEMCRQREAWSDWNECARTEKDLEYIIETQRRRSDTNQAEP